MPARVPRHDLGRVEGWEHRLIALANDWRVRAYAYGVSDCGRFAQAAIEAVTGVVLLKGEDWPRGWLGVARWMIANGWESVEDTMDDLLPRLPVDCSRRGDIVSFEDGDERHLAVRFGDSALTPSAAGLVIIERGRWRSAWKVG